MDFWDWFQIASIILFVVILMAKAFILRTRTGVNPIAIGRGKKGFHLVFELYSFLGLTLWIVEILSRSLHSRFRIFPSTIDVQLIDSPVAKVMGGVLVTLGLVTFAWAFYSRDCKVVGNPK